MDIASHVHQLLGLEPVAFIAADDLLQLIDDWEKRNITSGDPIGETDGVAVVDSGPIPPTRSTTLDLYRSHPGASGGPGASHSSIVQKLRSKPNLTALLPSLATILLADHRSNEAIQEEVLELLGYDEMDLVSEVLQDRFDVGRELAGPPEDTGKRQADQDALLERGVGKRKGKGKHKDGGHHDDGGQVGFTAAEAKLRMEGALHAAASRPLFSGTAAPEAPVYPHVYTSTNNTNLVSSFGAKMILPLGTTRQEDELCEEVIIPPPKQMPPKISERLIPVAELEPLAKGSFPGYTTLNRMQSLIYPTVYTTNENLLICAPTGAGKTDIAMLSVLRVLDQNRTNANVSLAQLGSTINRDDFKIIYVAPMKALASEITRKLGKRLAWLNIRVRELTGDMQMTRAEIAETQIIITTPEKWDVVTRKPTGEGELASKVKLLIIDEVHLLNEERGAVIETIIARTLRQVESTQSVIRIVGLSATLPNYVDVADFLRVSRYSGLFYFDQSFRPVPLEQHFIGVKGKTNSPTQKKNLDRITFEKVSELVRDGHQVMVFVHARKETVKSALALKEAIIAEGHSDDFDPTEHPKWEFFRREISTSRNKEMKELFDLGFGIHHAGMLRSDRNMMEKMFEARAIKVLFCTATLAWGVNLPAHAVLIKGTQVYDSGKGSFVDLSVLDVLQIFGRAGRPGMETSGVGYICTPDEKLDHYLNAISTQHPIESKFIEGMVDSLNAEISLGTVTTIFEAVQWLGYTYLFVRMRKNPFVYGIPYQDLQDDPQLGNKRQQLVTTAARKLAAARMIRFEEQTGRLTMLDLGTIAAKYYIRHATIEIFNQAFKAKMSEADVLGVLSMSTEFDQIQVRENELPELKAMEAIAPCQVKGGTDTSQGKVNILLQGYISKAYVEDFALVSDTAYAAQNGGRIIRALLEIAISRKWAQAAASLSAMSKAVEKRMWPYEHPLQQFSLTRELIYNLQQWADELSVREIATQTAQQLGTLIHMNVHHGEALLRTAKEFPSAAISYKLQPLTPDLLRVKVEIRPSFIWSTKVHGSAEPFWIWVEDSTGTDILQWSHLVFRATTKLITKEFTVPIPLSTLPPSITIRFISDKWLGAEEEIVVSFDELVMPTSSHRHSTLLDLPPLRPQALRNSELQHQVEAKFRQFNSIQTQAFFMVYNTPQNVLIDAPAASGKGILAQLAIRQAFAAQPAARWTLAITGRRSFAREFVFASRSFKEPGLEIQNVGAAGDLFKPIHKTCLRITTPDVLLAALNHATPFSLLESLCLVVCDDLEGMDDVYELSLSVLLQSTQTYPVRFVGLSASLNDPTDLSQWLRVPSNSMYSFRSSDREQALINSSHPSSIPNSPAFYKAMAKSIHTAVRSASSSIIFVPSRSLCRSISADLITQCAIEMETRGFLPPDTDSEKMEYIIARVKDRSLTDPIVHGIGLFHEGMASGDMALMLELFAEGWLRVVIMSREQCWKTALRAELVAAAGTQYLHFEPDGDRRTIDYSLQEVIRMQSLAVRHGQVGKFLLMCHAEERDTYMRFLSQGLPLESSLMESESFASWVRDRVRRGEVKTKQDLVDLMSFTFLARRLESNPTYYDTTPGQRDIALSRFVDRIWPDTIPVMPPEPSASEET